MSASCRLAHHQADTGGGQGDAQQSQRRERLGKQELVPGVLPDRIGERALLEDLVSKAGAVRLERQCMDYEA